MHTFASFLATDRTAELARQARRDRFAASARPTRSDAASLRTRIRAALRPALDTMSQGVAVPR
jgi:hypothetical protein